MPSDSALLRVRDLSRPQLGPLDLDLAAGERLCITGPSGAGKSLLLRALADLDPHDGEVWLDGADCLSMPAPDWRRQVALLAAESQWWAPRVGDHFPPGVDAGLQRLGFEPSAADWEIERLSSGEKQRLALARLLAQDPRVLLLDEPTANLDEANAAKVESLIGGWMKGGTRGVIWVSHDMEQVRRIADRHLQMEGGLWTAA
jgi:ABC-type iron transport system FetAB ATPase subunit